jgi:hypothetical protein
MQAKAALADGCSAPRLIEIDGAREFVHDRAPRRRRRKPPTRSRILSARRGIPTSGAMGVPVACRVSPLWSRLVD